MTIEHPSVATETVIRVDGAFDVDAACRLQALVAEVGAGCPLTLDFREVRLFHDSAICSLAAALSSHPDTRVVGLSLHHYRLLRYFREQGAAPSV